jgi:pentatricopeptide repeat protein
MAGNPRLDDLRKRLEKEPGSRLFAQLAEELRKEGELEESIQVAREGLKKHPAYPSARMTLGRALLDTGDLAAAKDEFEAVLKGAPDNILASRYLAECLEGLGDYEGATGRYKLTLQLAPGDKQAASRLHAVEEKLRETGSFKALPAIPPAAAPAAAAPAVAPPAAPPPIAPAPAPPAPPAAAPAEAAAEAEPAPIPLVEAEEEFELERPYEAGTAQTERVPETAPLPVEPAAPAETPPPAPAPPSEARAPSPPASASEFEFDLAATPTIPFQVTPVDVDEEVEPQAAAIERPPAAPAPPTEAGTGAELVSSTLAELYFKQGHVDKAREVYRQLVEREPTNDRVRQRFEELTELEQRGAAPAPPPARPVGTAAPAAPPSFEAAPPVVAPAPTIAPAPVAARAPAAAPAPVPAPAAAVAAPAAGDSRAARRQALERTIARLEGFLSAIRRSAP